MKEQVIHLEPHDDVTSVRDRLSRVQADRILLVFPEDPRERILCSRLDLVLIQREATRKQAQLALITRDHLVIQQARELGIACFPTVRASSVRHWVTRRARLSVSREQQPQRLTSELAAAGSRYRSGVERLPRNIRRGLEVTLFTITMAILLGGSYLLVPGATIHLLPASEQITVTMTITADPKSTVVDVDQGIIPARVIGVEVEALATVETSGTLQVPTEKARGTALFTNLLPDQVTIPRGTVVRTSAAQPVRFATLADATLPGQIGETVEVPIEALTPGFEGNLPSNRINQIEGPLAARLGVTNPQPTSGGDVTEVRAISQQDYDRVRALVLQQLQQRAFAEMQTDSFIALQSTEFIPVETLRVVLIHAETYIGYVGEAADEVGLNMRVTVQGVAIDERLARQVIYGQIAKRIGPGYQIAAESLIFRRGEIIQADDLNRVTFIMQGAGDVLATIDPSDVYRIVRSKPIDEAAAQLNRQLPLAAPASIETWPDFWPLMPAVPLRITVEVAGQS